MKRHFAHIFLLFAVVVSITATFLTPIVQEGDLVLSKQQQPEHEPAIGFFVADPIPLQGGIFPTFESGYSNPGQNANNSQNKDLFSLFNFSRLSRLQYQIAVQERVICFSQNRSNGYYLYYLRKLLI